MTPPSASRKWAWRVLLSALAGGGLTAAGLGPLAGGALAAEAQTVTTTTPESTVPTTTTETPPPAETTATQAPSTSSSSSTPAPAPSTTTTTTPTVTTTATPAPTTTAARQTPAPAVPPASGPAVVLQRKQKGTPSKSSPSAATPTQPTPGTTKKGAPANNNIAQAPQVVAAQAGALAAELADSATSSQALSFYRIPLFLLPIYQAASVQYGVPWQILAAINEIETNYGTDLSVSSAGAEGWMQFEPATWIQYGVDALNAGYADPYNPVDAIFAAARYLRAAGAATNLNAAILAYNHSDEYLHSVLLRAKLISSYPKSVIATLTGLTDGRVPVTGKRVVWGSLSSVPSSSSATAHASALPSATPTQLSAPTTASPSAPSPASAAAGAPAKKGKSKAKSTPAIQLVDLMSSPNATVVASQDGRIVSLGSSHKLGKYVILRDVYGDLFTYASLGSIATHYREPKALRPAAAAGASPLTTAETREPKPKLPASAGSQPPLTLKVETPAAKRSAQGAASPAAGGQGSAESSGEEPARAPRGKVRLFAHPGNPDALASAASARKRRSHTSHAGHLPLLRAGSIVSKGTVLGRVRTPPGAHNGHLRFAIRPGGDAETIDPRPILENWSQLAKALHPQGAAEATDLLGATASGVFLLSEQELQRTVLSDPGITIHGCARQDVASGAIDKRVLAVLAFLSRSGLKPTVSALGCDHGETTASGLGSDYHGGDAVDISAINGIPIAGHQGAGTITDVTIRALLTLQGKFVPHQIISLMQYPGAANTRAMPDHSKQIEIAFRPARGDSQGAAAASRAARAAKAARAAHGGRTAALPVVTTDELTTTQWSQLIMQIAALPAPKVAAKPSSAAIKDPKQQP